MCNAPPPTDLVLPFSRFCTTTTHTLQLMSYMLMVENFDSDLNFALTQNCLFHLGIAVKIFKEYLKENILIPFAHQYCQGFK